MSGQLEVAADAVDPLHLSGGLRIELPDDGWLLHSPGLFVDGTREAFEGVHIVLASGSYPLEALAAVLLDPKRVRASAAGVALAPAILPVVPELDWPELEMTERPERVVLVAADEEPPTVTLEARCSEGLAGFEVRVAGAVSFRPVEDAAANSTLTMELTRPAPGESIDYRWRAVGASGVLSRALHLTVETPAPR